MFGRNKKPKKEKMPGVPQPGIVIDKAYLLSVDTHGTGVIKGSYDSKIYADGIPQLNHGTRCHVAAHPERPDTTVAIDWSRFPA